MNNSRKPEYPVNHLFIDRRSSRFMSDQAIPYEELMQLFEAARWAPSSWNNQPWRFVYAQKGMPFWEKFFALLTSSNQLWACNADVLVIVVTKTTFDANGMISKTASYDVGAACQNLFLQATLQKLQVCVIGGFNYEQAATMLALSDEYKIEVMIAIGKPGSGENLPEKVRLKEQYSSRKPLKELVFNGEFNPF